MNKGFDNYLYVNTGTTGEPTWSEIDLAKDVTFNKEKNEIDATNRASARLGWEASEDGLKKWSANFDSHVPAEDEDANPAFDALDAAFMNNTSVEILRVRGGSKNDSGCYAEKVTCGVFGGNESEPVNDMATISYTVSAKAAPSIGTVSGGGFVEAS